MERKDFMWCHIYILRTPVFSEKSYVLISEFYPHLPFLIFNIGSKKKSHMYKMHLFSKSDMFFFVASESSKEIPDRNYL